MNSHSYNNEFMSFYLDASLFSLSFGRAVVGSYRRAAALVQNARMVMVHRFVTMLFGLVRNEKTRPALIFLAPIAKRSLHRMNTVYVHRRARLVHD